MDGRSRQDEPRMLEGLSASPGSRMRAVWGAGSPPAVLARSAPTAALACAARHPQPAHPARRLFL